MQHCMGEATASLFHTSTRSESRLAAIKRSTHQSCMNNYHTTNGVIASLQVQDASVRINATREGQVQVTHSADSFMADCSFVRLNMRIPVRLNAFTAVLTAVDPVFGTLLYIKTRALVAGMHMELLAHTAARSVAARPALDSLRAERNKSRRSSVRCAELRPAVTSRASHPSSA